MKKSIKRQKIIDTAIRLFKAQSFRGVGINKIISESGVAKATFYVHFRSKDQLIVEVLEHYRETTLEIFREKTENHLKSAEDKLIYIFDILEEQLKDKSTNGCLFVKATGEFSNRSTPIIHQVLLYKELSIAYFETLTRAAKLNDPKQTARQLFLLYEGAIAAAYIHQSSNQAKIAKEIAMQIIKNDE